MRFVLAGVVAVMLATFFHDEAARLFRFSASGEVRFTFLGFLIGGLFGCAGVLIAVIGLLQGAIPTERNIRLVPVLLMLVATVLLFFVLFYTTVTRPELPRLRPGETVTI